MVRHETEIVMELFRYTKPIGFMSKSKYAMIISMMLVLRVYFSDRDKRAELRDRFCGGTIVQVKYEGAAPIDKMREKLANNPLFEGSSINEFGSADEVVIRMKNSSESVTKDIGDVTREELQGPENSRFDVSISSGAK